MNKKYININSKIEKMKTFSFFLILLFPIAVLSQSIGDTLVVPTINYSQTQGSGIRDTMILFPDNPVQAFEKIIMSYNMRCKDGLVSVPGNTNLGCGEWDYSCNTYITDSSRVDSILSYCNSHSISHFTGETFEYVETPLHNYYQHLQKKVHVDNIISETQSTVGMGTLPLNHVIQTNEHSGKSQFLITQSELNQAGLTQGDINGIILYAMNNGDAEFFRIQIKHTENVLLEINSPEFEEFTEVYFADYSFAMGENRIQFYNPFNWDGVSNLIIELSFTNENPSNQLEIEGEDTGENYGIFATNGTHIINDMGYTEVPAGPLSSIAEEITVTFWCYGDPDFLPANTSIISGVDNDNNRQLNIHHPWGNSNIYFDCGYEGGYDRINKAATTSEIKGQWNHWAFIKNTSSSEMKIFYNGELWHSGTDKTRPIDIHDLIIGNVHFGTINYFGKIDELTIWSKEIEQATIQDWMNIEINDSHPNYNELVAYYKFDEGNGEITTDSSPYGETAQIHDYVLWGYERGNKLTRGFSATSKRPNIVFLQGDYNLTISDTIVVDSVETIANVVKEYEIIPRYGTTFHDSINVSNSNFFWEAGYEHIYGPDGTLIDSIEVLPTASIDISELTYYSRYPAKYEIMSFVTPYGIYLDLGMDGKTWYFDVSDYAPILKGWKRLTVELGGQRQEDMDIRFLFIEGTPPHDVIDNNQIWRPTGSYFTNIMNDRVFEPREFKMNPNGESFKIKSVITGHGQQGEFNPRFHTINIDEGEVEFEWKVWTECSTIPIYPQGGTWIYDRAGWCPGDPSDIYEYDITEYVTPGQTHTIDYGLTYAFGQSTYRVNKQLVTYGPSNFNLDAAVINITKPNGEIAAYERFNPACSYPLVVIQNTGSTTLTSLNIEYYVQGKEPMNYPWTGSLEFLETEAIELLIPDYSFWSGSDNKFIVNISNPNGQDDEYQYNNSYTIEFIEVDLYDVSESLTIECKTNNRGYQTSYSLTDLEGNIILEMDDLENNTIYTNEVSLQPGCYKLRIDDSGDDGLYWWHNSSQGTGYFRLLNSAGAIVENFEPEFGRFAIYEFGIVDLAGTEHLPDEANIISVFPNPTSDLININLKGYKNNNLFAEVFNSAMLKVYENRFYVMDFDYTGIINMKNMLPGVYFLRLEINGKTTFNKIIKN